MLNFAPLKVRYFGHNLSNSRYIKLPAHAELTHILSFPKIPVKSIFGPKRRKMQSKLTPNDVKIEYSFLDGSGKQSTDVDLMSMFLLYIS